MRTLTIFALLLSSFWIHAQTDSVVLVDPPSTSFDLLMDSIWMHVDKSTMKTQFLVDYGPWFTDPTLYNGSDLSPVNIINYDKLKMVYNSFVYSEIKAPYSLQEWDDLQVEIDMYTAIDQVPLLVLHLEFDKLSPQAHDNGWISTQGQYLYDVPETPSPFEQHTFFGVSEMIGTSASNDITFVLPSNFIFNNTEKEIDHLEADFSNGEGWKHIHPDQEFIVHYLPEDEGFKPIFYNIYYTDGSSSQTHGGITLKKKYDDDIPGNGAIATGEVWNDFFAETAFLGEFGKAKVTVAYGCGHTKLMKPLIIVPGIDPPEMTAIRRNIEMFGGSGDGIENETFQSFLAYLTSLQPDFIREIEQEGYDLVYIDYAHGADFVQRNGELTRSVIKEVNRVKGLNGSFEQNLVLGISMGGLVSRHALATMEQKNEDHDVKQWISFDAPHNGAYFPESYQLLLSQLANFDIIRSSRRTQRIRDIFPLVDLSMKIFENPCTKQMLYINDIGVGGPITNFPINPDYNNFQNFMDNLGYPRQCDFLAICHGSENMDAQQNTSPNMDMLDININATQLLAQLIGPILIANPSNFGPSQINISNAVSGILLNITGSNFSVNADLNGLPSQAQGLRQIYSGSLLYNPFGWFTRKITSDISVSRVMGMGAIETAPGGNFDVGFNSTIPGLNVSNDFFCFIPTVSSLALEPSIRRNLFYDVGSNFDHTNMVWLNNESPVQDFVSQSQSGTSVLNEEHATISDTDVDFLTGSSCDLIPDIILDDFDLDNQTFNFGANFLQATSNKIYPFLPSNTRLLQVSNGGVLAINSDEILGLNPGNTANNNQPPTSNSEFIVTSGSANCNPIDIQIEADGLLKIGDNTVDNKGTLILTSGSRLKLMHNGRLTIADHSTLIIEEGALLELSGNQTIHLEGENARIIIKGTIDIIGNASLNFNKGLASKSGYIHLFSNDFNQGNIITGSSSPKIDITGTNAFYDEVIRVEGGPLNIPANFSDFKITRGRINLVAGYSSTTRAALDIFAPINMDYCSIFGIGSAPFTANGLITYGQSNINMGHLYMFDLDYGWTANNSDLGAQPTIGFALIKNCTTGLAYEHLGQSSLSNVTVHSCETGIELYNYASGIVSDCNFTNITSNALWVFNMTSGSIHTLSDNLSFSNCHTGIDNAATYANTLTLKCTKFINNFKAMETTSALNMSAANTYNNFVGGDNTLYHCNYGIHLSGNPDFSMTNGNNNFYGLPGATAHNFVYGWVNNSALNSSNELEVSNNYWNPVPPSSTIASTGSSYCNLQSMPNYGFHPVGVGLTGALASQPNLTCFTPPSNGQQTGGYDPPQERMATPVFKIEQLKVIPNPMDQSGRLVFESAQKATYNMSIWDAFGRLIHQELFEGQAGENYYPISLLNQEPGLYFVKIYANNKLISIEKIIKINR